jgi:hypothetical protein
MSRLLHEEHERPCVSYRAPPTSEGMPGRHAGRVLNGSYQYASLEYHLADKRKSGDVSPAVAMGLAKVRGNMSGWSTALQDHGCTMMRR